MKYFPIKINFISFIVPYFILTIALCKVSFKFDAFYFCNVDTRKFKITCMACNRVLLNSTVLDSSSVKGQ